MMIFRLDHILAASAEKHPDQDAFRFMDQALTYAELQRRATQLARVLRENGVAPSDRVGIYLHKSLESALAVYGILLAGAAYVPLDPAAPPRRTADIIRDCDIRCVITHRPRLRGVKALSAESIRLDTLIGLDGDYDIATTAISWAEVAKAPHDMLPDSGVTEQDLAYIMYTSGSTGMPKGIMHTHHSGLSYARLAARTYGLRVDDRLANFAPLHFDQSTFELFAGPLVGATTIIVPEPHMKFPASLSQLVADEQITIWYSVPYALIQLLLRGMLEERDCRAVRWVLYGGEPFPPKHLNALMAAWPHATFSNVYGPAEVNQCTYYHIPRNRDDVDAPVPIGRIWDNTTGLIVDEDDQPVDDGAIGELLVCTPTMMAGYWARPELNAQAFFTRQILPEFEEIYYRTGDLVRRDAVGLLHFIGRKDRQIKSRGFRIELDEIEATLCTHPAVEEAAVYPTSAEDGDQQIAAAVTLRPNHTVDETTLSRHVRKALPAYAVPGSIVVVTSFPRTTSGKIDRRALQNGAIILSIA
ncbi:MAG: amino acid adenylation domain-containing protein [Anaerolineae bacterium]|nr:amino acid adenylation domain-containing protein [Anaerolineae bacterium]